MAQIGEHSSTDSALEYLESLLAGTATSEMRRTVFAASAISTGGAFSLQLLAHVVSAYHRLSDTNGSSFYQTGQSLNSIAKLIDTFAQEAQIFTPVAPLAVFGENEREDPFIPRVENYEYMEDYTIPDSFQRSPKSDLFAFTHDQLQQAAKDLLPVSQRAVMHAHIGGEMLTLLSPTMDEVLLQILVYNLNESRLLGFCASKEDDLLLIELNIRVARVEVSVVLSTLGFMHQCRILATFCCGSSGSSTSRTSSEDDRS